MKPYIKVMGHVIGPKYLKGGRFWIPSLLGYLGALTVGIFWISENRYVMKKIPIYNQRFLYPYENDKIVFYTPRLTLEEDDDP